MISKLPRWVEYGAFILAFVAGLINAVGLLGFKHQSISHLSGIATSLGTSLIEAPFLDSFNLAMILLSFLLGAAISGSFLRSGSVRLGSNYSALLVIEASLLMLSVLFLTNDLTTGHYLASAACGLQNALVTRFSGAVVRTTHVTGIFTDLGLMLGARLRGERFDTRKAFLFILIVSGFISGGTLGAVLFPIFHFKALFMPAGICLLLALAYAIYTAKTPRT